MLDPRVTDLSLRVPSTLKMNGKELRTFYKGAMRAFLPREILEKEKHGFGHSVCGSRLIDRSETSSSPS